MIATSRNLLVAVAGLALLLAAAPAHDALAAPAKSTENEAEFLSFDPAAKTVTVKITKNGRGPNKKMVKTGQEVTFNVKPEGSVLTRTTVKINGQRAEIKDLPEGKTILIRWVPDPSVKDKLFARGIDAILSDAELDERYPDQD